MRKTTATKVFFYPDIHWAYRDEEALSVADAAHRAFHPDITVIGGDLLSCEPFKSYAASGISEDSALNWQQDELLPALAWLKGIRRRTGTRTIFLEGNHEERIERWCAQGGAGRQACWSFLSPRHLLPSDPSFIYVPRKDPRMRGSSQYALSPLLGVVHGWTCCKHAAAKHLELSRTRSIVFNHTHRRQRCTSRDPWSNEPLEAVSFGCLCKHQPLWMHGDPTEWTHGFGVGYLGRATYTLYDIPIVKGSAVLPSGKEIKAP